MDNRSGRPQTWRREVKEFGNGAHVTLPNDLIGKEVIVGEHDQTLSPIEEFDTVRITEYELDGTELSPLAPHLKAKIHSEVDINFGPEIFRSAMDEPEPGLFISFGAEQPTFQGENVFPISAEFGGFNLLEVSQEPGEGRYDVAITRLVDDLFEIFQAVSYKTDPAVGAIKRALRKGHKQVDGYHLKDLYETLTDNGDARVTDDLTSTEEDALEPLFARIQPILENDDLRNQLVRSEDTLSEVVEDGGILLLELPPETELQELVGRSIKRRFLSIWSVTNTEEGKITSEPTRAVLSAYVMTHPGGSL